MLNRRDWGVPEYTVAALAAVVACGGLWLAGTHWPRPTLVAVSWLAAAVCATWIWTRDLRVENEDLRKLLDTQDRERVERDLSTVGPVSPASATTVVPYDWADEHKWEGFRLTLPGDVRPVGAGPGDVGHLTVAPGKTGWLGPEDVTFHPPVEMTDLGQVCAVCGETASGFVRRTEMTFDDGAIDEITTFLCDDHYADAMAEGCDDER